MRHFQSLSEKFLYFLVTFFLRARSNLFLNVQWIILKKKNVLNRIFSWLTTFGVWAKIFCISDSNLPSGLSKWNSMCQWIFFHETNDFEKIYIITMIFGFWTAIFQVWVKKFLAGLSVLHSICLEKIFERISCWKQTLSHCFFRFLRFSFFCEITQIFIGSVVRSELYLSTGLSSW